MSDGEVVWLMIMFVLQFFLKQDFQFVDIKHQGTWDMSFE
jgi:hypothetical protein